MGGVYWTRKQLLIAPVLAYVLSHTLQVSALACPRTSLRGEFEKSIKQELKLLVQFGVANSPLGF
jgi:hypothetical protein